MFEVIPTRSRNGNVFKYDAYWQKWSRILFHDPMGSRGMQKMREQHNVPQHVRTIELDLTAVNPMDAHDWRERVQHANLRDHCTPLDRRDIITGVLPAPVIEQMLMRLPIRTIDVLLHGDYLPLIDFQRMRLNPVGGGARFREAFRPCLSFNQWQAAGGNRPTRTQELCDWQDYADEYADKIAALTPNEFNVWEEQ
jgi:hypothetical protein